MAFTPHAHPGFLHHYLPRLVAFEHNPSSSSALNHTHAGAHRKNYLLFLGGLGNGLGDPHYPSLLAEALASATGPEHDEQWVVVEVLLSSSYTGWTTSTLERDADELEHAIWHFLGLQGRIKPLRQSSSSDEGPQTAQETSAAQANEQAQGRGKIALLGHSTGCQIIMQYLTSTPSTSSAPRPPVDGIILQAGISDREAIPLSDSDLASSLSLAKSMVAAGQKDDHLPFSAHQGVFEAAPSAERWISLAEKGGGDDFFSSDLGDEVFEKTFGRVGRMGVKVCVLFSGEDQHVPGWVDKEALVGRWERAVRDGWEEIGGGRGEDGKGAWDEASGVVKGARHDPSGCGGEVLQDVFGRVRAFLGRC